MTGKSCNLLQLGEWMPGNEEVVAAASQPVHIKDIGYLHKISSVTDSSFYFHCLMWLGI